MIPEAWRHTDVLLEASRSTDAAIARHVEILLARRSC